MKASRFFKKSKSYLKVDIHKNFKTEMNIKKINNIFFTRNIFFDKKDCNLKQVTLYISEDRCKINCYYEKWKAFQNSKVIEFSINSYLIVQLF